MGRDICRAGNLALVLLGEIPALGPSFRKKEEACWNAHLLLKKIDCFLCEASLRPYQIMFRRHADGRFTLVLKNDAVAVNVLSDLDELLFKRFQKFFRKIFILTTFYEADGKLECLAVTEGLGAVLYSSCDFGFLLGR